MAPVLRRIFRIPAIALTAAAMAGAAAAGEADVGAVKVTKTASGVYRFDVTVEHADAGWKHYANRWDVVAPDGSVLGERVLLHPHDNEQPFTRSLSGVRIPAGTDYVTVRANDLVHGPGGREMRVAVPE